MTKQLAPEVMLAFVRDIPRNIFTIDLRTLALFRMALAVCCIAQVVSLWPDAGAFLHDGGLFPRPHAFAWNNPYAWSLYYVSGHVVWAQLLLALTVLSSLAMLAGYRTRLMTVITWILIASLMVRISMIRNGGHVHLMLLMFWAMFLPLGARWSVDALRFGGSRGDNAYFSAATAAVLIQKMYMYFFGAMIKTGDSWRVHYDSVYYIFNTTDLSSPLAPYFADWIGAHHFLTAYVLYVELYAVLFLFSPVKTVWTRLFILPFLASLHIGFLLFMSIGLFPIVCLAGLIIFIPGLVWDRLSARESRWRGYGLLLAVWLTARLPAAPPRDPVFYLHPVTRMAVLLLTGLVMVWNIGHLPGQKLGAWFRPLYDGLSAASLAQMWVFFAPGAHDVTHWTVLEGHPADGGEKVDLLRHVPDPPSHELPRDGYEAFPNNYWWEFFIRVDYHRRKHVIGGYFCTVWNRDYPELPIVAVTITAYSQKAPPPGQQAPARETRFSYTHECK